MNPSLPLVCLASLLPVVRLAAQAVPMPSADPRPGPVFAALQPALDGRVALGWHDGALRAAGAGYKAEFTAEGVEMVPAFGLGAPHDLPLHWRTVAIGRDGEPDAVPPASPRLGAVAVDYDRGSCRERYEPRPDGLEQSFVFAARPRGRGDLVVRGTLATELLVTPQADGGLRLAAPGIGSCAVTGVVGVAADGARCRGTLRWRPGVVEYVLPAAFVDTAALPLVLDPTWITQLVVETSTAADRHPDAALCFASSRKYLVAWEHVFSATDFDVYGQFVDSNGQLSGTRLFLAATAANERSVSLASNGADGFVLAYASGTGVLARTLDAGVLGPALTVASTGSSPDVGAHLAVGGHRFAIVWDNGLGIDYAVYSHNGSGLSLYSGPSSLLVGTATAPFNLPSISHTSGIGCDGTCTLATGEQQSRWAIVAQRDWSTDSDLQLRIVDLNGAIVGSYAIDTSTEDHDFAEVDGNGRDWLVAWQRRVGSERDVVARQFTLPLGSATVTAVGSGPTVIAGAPGLVEVYPSVTCIGMSCMIGYVAEVSAGQFQPRMTSRSLIGCEACAGDVPLPGNLTTAIASGRLPVASLQVLDPREFGTLVAYEYPDPAQGGNGQILAFTADFLDGALDDLGGNCGAGSGTVLSNCATAGSPALRLHLRDSRPGTLAFLVLSPQATALWCGSCRLFADPFAGFVVSASTDALGAASVTLPAVASGALRNRPLYLQWLIPAGNPPGCSTLGVDLSSAKRLFVQ